jgi:L-arabinose isomerase
VVRAHENADVDGLLVVMLTYGPGQRVARALGQTRLPLCLANIQPEPNVTAEWDMADMTYNQGVHGAQDTAQRARPRRRDLRRHHRGLAERRVPRARRPLGARRRRGDRAGAPQGRQVGYAMDDMGDIRVDEGALLRSLGPSITVDRARATSTARRSR